MSKSSLKRRILLLLKKTARLKSCASKSTTPKNCAKRWTRLIRKRSFSENKVRRTRNDLSEKYYNSRKSTRMHKTFLTQGYRNLRWASKLCKKSCVCASSRSETAILSASYVSSRWSLVEASMATIPATASTQTSMNKLTALLISWSRTIWIESSSSTIKFAY